jgi:hypothetical protein
MTNKSSHARAQSVIDAAYRFAERALADGTDPFDLYCALTVLAVRIALDVAPSAEMALALVMRAATDAAMALASPRNSQDAVQQRAATLPETTVH